MFSLATGVTPAAAPAAVARGEESEVRPRDLDTLRIPAYTSHLQ